VSELLRFAVRRFRAHPLPGKAYDEPNFGHVEHEIEWRPEQTAVLTIDVWNMLWLPEPLDPELERYAEYNFMGVGESLMSVMHAIESECIVPALAAAREAGLTVIHSNMYEIARKHPESAFFAEPPEDGESAADPSWAPAEVSEEWIAEYYRHTWGEDCMPGLLRIRELADFPPPLMPEPGDIVVCRQYALDSLLAERGICNLICTGFMLNMCLMQSVGGVMRMVAPHRNPGYRGIVLRDCTCATETADTIGDLAVTNTWLYQMETTGIPMAESSDFIAACRAISPSG